MNKLILKNIKLHEGLSDETPCYQATAYLGKTKIAHLENQGCGGSDSIGWEEGGEELWLAHAKEQGVDQSNKWHSYANLESCAHELVWNWADERRLKRLLKSTILISTDVKGSWTQLKVSKANKERYGSMEKIVDAHHVALKKGTLWDIPSDRVMLNVLPFDEALKAFQTL